MGTPTEGLMGDPKDYQYPTAEQMKDHTDEPVIPIEHADWEVVMVPRKMFGEQVKEKPWIRHQEVTPRIRLHLCSPVEDQQEDGTKIAKCICGDKIPDVVVLKYYWMTGIYQGKRLGAKTVPKDVKVTL